MCGCVQRTVFLVALLAAKNFAASQSSVTLVCSVEAIAAIVGSVVAGLVMRGANPGRASAGGFLAALAGSLTLIYAFVAVSFSAFVAGTSLVGFATDMAVAGLTASILMTTRRDSAGLAQSLFSAGRQVGGALGVAVYGSVGNATSALWIGVLCSFVGIALCAAKPGDHCVVDRPAPDTVLPC